jgi:threonine dehydratase
MNDDYRPPDLAAMGAARERLAPYIMRTPVVDWPGSDMVLKLESFQRTGTFKARGALNNLLTADGADRVTAFSAGNHAIAVAYAASVVGADAKVVMQATANPARIAATKAFGAEVLIEPDGAAALARAEALVAEEGRLFVHPFEGPRVTEATAGVALELIEDAGALDAIVVAIGGGGLAGGVAAAAKQLLPACAVYGVEPEGAAVMSGSLEAGAPLTLDHLDTIADSLAPPMTTPYAFATCRHYLDDVVVVSDDQMAAAAALLFTERKLAVEPAGAAAAAAAFGPLRQRLAGKRIGLIVCGANIDRESFCSLIARGEAALGAGVLAAGS